VKATDPTFKGFASHATQLHLSEDEIKSGLIPPEKWGGDLEILAFEKMNKTTVLVFMASRPGGTLFNIDAFKKAKFILHYNGRDHFNVLRRKLKMTPEQMFQLISRAFVDSVAENQMFQIGRTNSVWELSKLNWRRKTKYHGSAKMELKTTLVFYKERKTNCGSASCSPLAWKA
jgi:hypothetical protein